MAVYTAVKSTLHTMWKILVIDDDEDDLILVKEMLKEAKGRKYDIHWASTYQAGREALRGNHFNAVLVDYDLGPHTGIELIRETSERGYAAPLILFTGRGSYEVDVEAMQAGATLYLTKNEANPLLLERAIRYAIELKQKEQSLRESEAHLRESEAQLRKNSAALRVSEERFHKAFNASPNAQVISRREDGHIEIVNDRFEQLFGYRRDEVIGKTSLELNMFSNPADREEAVQRLQADGSLRNFELDIRTKSGDVRLASLSIEMISIDNERLMLTILEDITERKRAEAALRESEARFRALTSASTQVLYRMSPDWSEIRQMQGGSFLVDTDKPTPNWMAEYIHPDDQPWVGAVIDNAVRTGTVFDLEHRVLRADGAIGWTASRAVPIRNAEGEIVEWFGAASDISERKQLEEELQKNTEALRISEEKFALAFQNSPVAIAISNASNARFVDVNNSYCELYGFRREELVGHTSIEVGLFPNPEDRQAFARLFAQGTRLRNVEFKLRTKTGESRDVMFSTDFIKVDGENCILTTVVDITQRKRAEEELQKAHERMVWLARFPNENPNPAARVSENGTILYCNRASTNPQSWSFEEGRQIPPSLRPLLDEANKQGKRVEGDFPIGDRLYAVTVMPFPDDHYVNFYGRDITERKHAEAEREQLLNENRIRADQLETVVQALPVGVWVTDADGRILMKNQQADLIWLGDAPLSASIDAYQAYQSWDAVTGRQIQAEEYPLAIALRTGQPVAPVEHVIRRFDGSEGSVIVSVRPIKDREGHVTGAVAVNVDITERRKIENELRQREELLEAFFANSPGILNIVDTEFRYIKSDPITPTYFGLDRQSIIGKRVGDLAPEFVDSFGAMMQRVIETGQPEQKLQVQSPVSGRSDDMTYWLASYFQVPLPGGQRGLGVMGVDISQQKKAELALREIEQRYSALFNAKTNGIAHCRVITDEQGRPIDYEYLQVNDAYEAFTGMKPSEMVGRRAREVFPGIENYSNDYIGNYGQVALQGGELNFETFGEAIGKWLSIFVYSPRLGEFTVIFSDISQRKQAEAEQQEQAIQIEVQRRLMDQREQDRSTIARDLHDGPIQTLSGTMFHLQLIQDVFPDPALKSELSQHVMEIQNTIRELRGVMNNLRPPALITFGLSKVLQTYLEDFRERFPDFEIELNTAVDDTKLSSQAHLTLFRIFQAGINNIIRHSDASKIWVTFKIEQDSFLLELRDNGVGFDPKTDFSQLTRDGHFGLVGMKERAEAIGAEFSVSSGKGKGTTLVVKGRLSGKNLKQPKVP